MEPRAHHIFVGVFTLTISIAAIFFSLWLAKTGSDKHTSQYTVVFTEPVRGLTRGAAVQYNGIRIGEVNRLELDANNVNRVLASITIQDTIPIKEDTRARLTLTGITGSSVIELTGGSTASPELGTSSTGEHWYIPAIPSPISQLMSGGEDLMTNLSELILNANAFLTTENAQSVSRTLAQTEQLITQLSSSTEGVAELVNSLTQTSTEATKLLNGAMTLVAAEGNHLFAQFSELMEHLSRTANEAKKMIVANAPSINQGSQGLAQLAPIMQELRQTIQTIRTISQEVQDNPKDYLFGADKLQEFEP